VYRYSAESGKNKNVETEIFSRFKKKIQLFF